MKGGGLAVQQQGQGQEEVAPVALVAPLPAQGGGTEVVVRLENQVIKESESCGIVASPQLIHALDEADIREAAAKRWEGEVVLLARRLGIARSAVLLSTRIQDTNIIFPSP